jgi:hypothetical protein
MAPPIWVVFVFLVGHEIPVCVGSLEGPRGWEGTRFRQGERMFGNLGFELFGDVGS